MRRSHRPATTQMVGAEGACQYDRAAFERDERTFDALATTVLPSLLVSRAPDATLCIWVPGCSTGQEVYALAIDLLELLGDIDAADVALRFFGTDERADALAKARAATYPSSIARQMPAHRLERFFSRTDGGYAVRPHVRDLCAFAMRDTLHEPFLTRVDLVSAHRLMSQLTTTPRERALSTFHRAIASSGFLLLPRSMGKPPVPGFATIAMADGVYRRRESDATAALAKLARKNRSLRTTNQEIRASNDELSSVNNALVARNADVTRIGDDLASVLNSVEIPIVILGPDARIRHITPGAGTLFGLRKDDVGRGIGAAPRAMYLAPALREVVTEARRHGGAAERTIEDQSGRWHELRAVPYVTGDGWSEGTVVMAVDVDAVKKEAALRAVAQTDLQFQELLTAAPEAILVINGAGRLTFSNKRAQELFGYTADEMRAMDVIAALAPARLHENYTRRLSGYFADAPIRAEGREPDLYARRKDGTEFPIEFVVSATARDGHPMVVAFVTDITGKRESERKLFEFQERLQQMAFDTALAESRERRRIAVNLHDSLGQTLMLTHLKLSTLRDSLPSAVSGQVDEVMGLLGRSISETRTLMFELSPPVLYDLGLKEALSWLIEELGRLQGLVVELTDDDEAKPLDDATAALVFRAVRELLLNVSKHARSDAAKVSLRRAGDSIAIDVVDQGVGFNPGNVTLSATGGFGLLSVRDQIGRLGGSVEISSAPRHGTRVRLNVPLKKEAFAARILQ